MPVFRVFAGGLNAPDVLVVADRPATVTSACSAFDVEVFDTGLGEDDRRVLCVLPFEAPRLQVKLTELGAPRAGSRAKVEAPAEPVAPPTTARELIEQALMCLDPEDPHYVAEVREAMEAYLAQPEPEPVATLHDDGCFTWKRDEYRLKFEEQRAGWRMEVYAAPQPAEPAAQPARSAVETLLRKALRDAEWQDKHIHPVNGEGYQNWKITVYLPVPFSTTDKSAESALNRLCDRPPAEPPTDEQIVAALEAHGIRFQRFQGGITGTKDCWSTSGSQDVRKLANAVRSILANGVPK